MTCERNGHYAYTCRECWPKKPDNWCDSCFGRFGPSRAAIGETEMHYGECLLWVDALEWFIREHGLEVPTWRDVKQAGWQPRQPVDL
jgi:hypothetical protein